MVYLPFVVHNKGNAENNIRAPKQHNTIPWQIDIMSRLSEPLKAFINATHARPNTTAAPRHIASVYEKIASDAGSKQVGLPAWLCASVCVHIVASSGHR